MRTVTLSIICGLPGSGKTTMARRLEEEHAAIRMNADDWMEALGLDLWDQELRARIEAKQWEQTQRLLAIGVSVVVEWGSWSRAERDRLRSRAHELGAKAKLHFLDADCTTLIERIAARGRENPPITLEDLLEWDRLIERPTSDELALFD